MNLKKTSVLIVGAGPAGLMLAAELDSKKFDVAIAEKNSAPGRKFLVAGDGGLNITHSEDPEVFISRYTPAGFLRPAFLKFNNRDLVSWLRNAGVDTYTGSSGRVFPVRNLKPVSVLNAVVKRVTDNGVKMLYRHEWRGFSDNGSVVFEHDGRSIGLSPDVTAFALGGASWPVTGSKGEWLAFFRKMGVATKSFASSNCTMHVEWPPEFMEKHQGKPIKNISVTCANNTVRGEIVITRTGIEGSGIYPLSPVIRQQLAEKGIADIYLDLKPSLTKAQVIERFSGAGRSRSDQLRMKHRLSDTAIALLKSVTSREDFKDTVQLADAVKSLPIRISGLGTVEDAISTVGGIHIGEIDEHFMLKALRGHYAIGEMLDYDAPTGGYLLQSCFSMGYFLAWHLNNSRQFVE